MSWEQPSTRHRRVGAEFISTDGKVIALRRCSCRLQYVGTVCPNAGQPYIYRPPKSDRPTG